MLLATHNERNHGRDTMTVSNPPPPEIKRPYRRWCDKPVNKVPANIFLFKSKMLTTLQTSFEGLEMPTQYVNQAATSPATPLLFLSIPVF